MNSKKLGFNVSSFDALDLQLMGELVVRFRCPHCYKPLRRSFQVYLYAEMQERSSGTEVCGHCGNTINLTVNQTATSEVL